MNPPDEGTDLSLLIESSLEQYLREFLSGRHSITEVELADAVVLYFRGGERYAIFDEGDMWVYEPENGVFIRLVAAEIANGLYDLDGTLLTSGPYRATNARANAVIRVVRHRLTEVVFSPVPREGSPLRTAFLSQQMTAFKCAPARPISDSVGVSQFRMNQRSIQTS